MFSAREDSDKREKAKEVDDLLVQVEEARVELPKALHDQIARISSKSLEQQETDQLSQLSQQLRAFLQLSGNSQDQEDSQTIAASTQIDRSSRVNSSTGSKPTALHCAIRDGQTDVALELLYNGASIDALDDEGNTPLMTAVACNQFDCALRLIEQGADLSVKNWRGFTAADLAFASEALETLKALEAKQASLQFDTDVHSETVLDLAEKNSTECLKYWLENYPKQVHQTDKPCNLRYKDGRTVSHAAALSGSKKILLLVEEAEGDLDLPDNVKCTPLFCAVQNGSEEVVDFLLKKGCRVNQVCDAGRTPLFAAVINGRDKIVKMLLDAGADIQIKDKEGKCPIAHSIESKHQAVFDCLIQKRATIGKDNDSAEGHLVQLAAQLNQCEMLQSLHSVNQLPLDVPNKSNGKTALMNACQIGSEKIVTYLLENGSDANRVDCAGNTPALLAASEGHQNILRILKSNNAKLDEKNALGETAVLVAAKSKANAQEIVDFLFRHSCNLNVVDINGNSVASYAASSLNLALLKLLIMYCCQLDLADNRGNTPLMKAIMAQSDDHLLSRKFVRKLLQHECRPCVKNNKGNSAISIAAKTGRMDLLTLFAKRDEALLNINRKGKTIMMQVVAKNQVCVLQYLERESAGEMSNRNATDVFGRTAVHIAAMKGHLESLEHLVKQFKCTFDTKDKQGLTPFMLAVKEDNVGAAKWLAKIGADVNLRNNRGENAAHLAAQRGSLAMMKLLERIDCCLDQEDKLSKTPLMIACALRNMPLVDFLLSNKVVLDGFTKVNRHCLHFACEAGAFEIVEKLVSQNAVTDASDSFGVTPLMLSALAGSSEISKLLISRYKLLTKAKDKKGKTCLEYAIVGENSDLVRELIEAGCDVNNRQNDGRTPLLVALETKTCASDKTVLELLKHDCELNAVTKDGLNAAHLACKLNKPQVLKILIEKGIDIFGLTKSLDNCLTLAVPNGSAELVALLIKFGFDKSHMNKDQHSAISLAYRRADENILSMVLPVCDAEISKAYENGSTLLHLACESSSTKLIEDLIERDGSLLHKRNGQLETPLHIACQSSKPELVKLLLKRGADSNASDDKGETPIFRVAVGSANLEIYKTLLSHNVDVNVINKFGVSVLAAAFRRGSRPAIDLLLSSGAELSPDSLPESYEIFRENFRARRNKNLTDLLSLGLSVNRRESKWHILHLALETSRSDLVAELLRRGASVAVKDEEGNTPLLTAVRFGQVCFAKQILEQHPETVDDVDKNGDSVLHVAVSAGKLSTLKCLLTSCEFPRNVTNRFQETALHVAAKLGLQDLYDLLLKSGWDSSLTLACFDQRLSVFELAGRSGNSSFAVKLHQRPHDIGVCESLCRQFAASGQTVALKNLFRYQSCKGQLVMSVRDAMIASGNQFLTDWAIDKNVWQVNYDAENRGNRLFTAVRIGNYHLCLMFVKKNCSLDVRSNNGFTLVHEAVVADHEPILRYLIHQGARAKEVDSNGNTPLLLAVRLGRTRLVQVLHGEFACDLSTKNSQLQQSAVHIAAFNGQTKILKYLKKHMRVRCFDEVDINNETPLMLAIRAKSAKCVKALLDEGARINATNHSGVSALGLMLASEDPDIRHLGESRRPELEGTYIGPLNGNTGIAVSAQDMRGEPHLLSNLPQPNTGPISAVRHSPQSVDDMQFESSHPPANGASFGFNNPTASATDL